MRTKTTVVALAAAAIATACSAGVVIAGGAHGPADNSGDVERALDSRKPKNVILLIGDGTGDSELTIGRYYLQRRGRAADGLRDAPVHRRVPHVEPQVRARSRLRAELRPRLGADGDRLVDGQEDR